MIELLFLFLIVISIVLCTFALSYKCTDGSMSMKDFKLSNCYMLSRQEEKEEKEEIPDTPLMSEETFKFVQGEEDDEDYSTYVDYYDLNRKAVRADNEEEYKDVYADGAGHCAKMCYEKEHDINNNTCNAFQTDNARKCRLFWSTSEFGDGRSSGEEIAFRLKTPRDVASHEQKKETQLESGTLVYAYSQCNYNGSEFQCSFNDYTSGHFDNKAIKSVVVPMGHFVELFTGTNLSGTSVILDNSTRCIEGTFHSVRVGQISGGVREYYSPPEEGE